MGESGETIGGDLPTRVADNPELHRYEIFVNDTLAGFTTYRLRPENRRSDRVASAA